MSVAKTSFSQVAYPFLTSAVLWKAMHATPPDGYPSIIIKSILLMPRQSDGSRPPLIVVPHSGPHYCTSTTYLTSSLFLCMQGMSAVLLVNYRGSVLEKGPLRLFSVTSARSMFKICCLLPNLFYGRRV